MRKPPEHSGFSLLELIIVLVVITGLLAIVWPNLQRPLSRTTLTEAAQTLRDAIDESRYQATIRGMPQFVHLSQGQSEFESGTFEAFSRSALSPLENSNSGRAQSIDFGAGDASSTASIKCWRLPPSVVISRVSWTLDLSQDSSLESSLDTRAASSADLDNQNTTRTANGSRGRNSEAAANVANAAPVAPLQSELQWWLPFLATGQGRDAQIELFDNTIEQSLTVTYESATGALEVSR